MHLRDLLKNFRIGKVLLRRAGVAGIEADDEEFFWDQYVKNWERSDRLNKEQYVGSEWEYETDFLALLRKYASPDSEALEIGCGGGRITASGVQLFKHVYAADLSAEMLRKCRQAVAGSAVSFHKLDGFTLREFADSSVDFVYSHDVFVQLSSMQVYPYFVEIGRVLRCGGLGLISCYDFVDQFELFKQTSLKFWNRRTFLGHKRRLHFLTEDMIRTMLSDVGFEIQEIQKSRFLTVAFRRRA
jgi:ubiquinone/menaquinone biosynthesis C-methylase UbiE